MADNIGKLQAELALRADAIVGESPVWSVHEKVLYWVDISRGLIHRFNPETGNDEIFKVPQPVSALALRERGGLVLALRDGFAFFDLETEKLEMINDPEADLPDNRFNDAKCDPQGRFWGGTMSNTHWNEPSGNLYRLDPDFKVTKMRSEVVCSNGMGWSPDGWTMYHTESFRYTIFAFDYDCESGNISNRRAFATVNKGSGAFPDGLTVDEEGYIWSVHNAMGKVVRYNPEGKIVAEVDVPVPRPCGCTFGGENFDMLYITTARETLTDEVLKEIPLCGSIFVAEPRVRGRPEPFFAG
jgi:sugar lactone lactonase YvrE